MAGFIFVFPLIGEWTSRQQGKSLKWARRGLMAAAVAVTVVILAVTPHFATGYLTRPFGAVSPAWDDTTQAMDWFDLERGLRDHGALNQLGVVVAARDWVEAAKIGYALGPGVTTIVLREDSRHFAYLAGDAPSHARSILLIGLASPERESDVAANLRRLASPRFCDIHDQHPISLTRGGRNYRTFVVLKASAQCGAAAMPQPSPIASY